MSKNRGPAKNKGKAKRAEYFETRKPFIPEYGQIYEHINGVHYECIDFAPSEKRARFRNVKTLWMKIGHNIGIYEDGRIDWEYSTGAGI